MKPTLLFQAPVSTRSGYGDHSRDLLWCLRELNKFDIKIISTRWGMTPMDALNVDDEFHNWIVQNILPQPQGKPDIFVQVSVPNEFQPFGHYNIGITAGIETTVSNMNWIQGCNRMDLNIVPSIHSKTSIAGIMYNEADKTTGQVIRQHKLEKPMEIVFEGYSEKAWAESDSIVIQDLKQVKEDFAFLYVGHWLRGDLGEDRKNTGMLIKTFGVMFKNEPKKPALILKTSSATFSVRDRELIIRKIKDALGQNYGAVPVYLLHGDLSESEMYALYKDPKVKAMISFTKGEGFGRPLLEFSLTGKPVIATKWSGHLDFLKEGAVLLEGDLKKVHDSAADDFLLKDAEWFNVNISKSIPAIKSVYNNYESYIPNAKKLAEANKTAFSITKMKDALNQVFEKYSIYSKAQPKFQQIQLPKLKTLNKK